jgi:hypothetical protein
MKIFYTYILMTKDHKFYCISCVGFLKKIWFHEIGKILLKIHTLELESTFFWKNRNIAKPYHMKIHWFEHSHGPNP